MGLIFLSACNKEETIQKDYQDSIDKVESELREYSDI